LVRSLLQADASFPDSLRVLTVGGDVLAPDHVRLLLERRLRSELYLTYGLTQAGPRVATLAAHREPPHRFASVGAPLPETRVVLEDVGDGSGRRQLLVASPTLMRRRIGVVEDQPEESRPSGFLATGDAFAQDNDGYLYYQGRLADGIVRAGEKICLAAVRRVATALPGVVAARTVVDRRDSSDTNYDLVLIIGSMAVGASERSYRARLAQWLRPGEMPRRIQVVAEDAEQSFRYK
jgi:acyl-coenzyme A synthetase/AMP-(fatty) acid ligase